MNLRVSVAILFAMERSLNLFCILNNLKTKILVKYLWNNFKKILSKF